MKTIILSLILLAAVSVSAQTNVIYPIGSVGSPGVKNPCPGTYAGYVDYQKTAAQGWGWKPNTNAPAYTIRDTNRTDTKIVYLGKFSDNGCGQTTVSVPKPAPSQAYRFTVYFTVVPTNATTYPLTLTGFNP